ncbi:hypothetical protein Enr13x_33730 [Stieleria neptunia]|uniref:Uncharacterized protein n=1 Tax=Stieleria neptunia TaxID=2527979 RepID=A0A518HRP0_9BACT|nr:hypothetical protein Enr13x_33730 [Stieleria neptunia]
MPGRFRVAAHDFDRPLALFRPPCLLVVSGWPRAVQSLTVFREPLAGRMRLMGVAGILGCSVRGQIRVRIAADCISRSLAMPESSRKSVGIYLPKPYNPAAKGLISARLACEVLSWTAQADVARLAWLY